MDGGLPLNLLDEILFRTDPRSLAMMRCTNKFLQSHISEDPYFESEYFSRIGSGLLHISTYGAKLLLYHPHGDSSSPRTEKTLTLCHVLSSCSGLLLLFVDGLYVANPLTKKFRLLDHFRSKFFPKVIKGQQVIGFAVDRVKRTTQSFKIVIITERRNNDNETTYGFETNAGGSWKISETTITCISRNLDNRMRKPVYLEGSLYWLRNDGSIIAFNTKTEQARLIPVWFPQELSSRTLFAADDNNLTLVSATNDVIYVYALKEILSDPKWVLVRRIRNGVLEKKRRIRTGVLEKKRRIRNGVLEKKRLIRWNVEAYDGKCLVLREEIAKYEVIRGYDLRANKWIVMGWVPRWCDKNRDFFQFSPSTSLVIGLDGEVEEERVMGSTPGWDDMHMLQYLRQFVSSTSSSVILLDGKVEEEKRTSSILSIMGLIDWTTSGKIGKKSA